LAKLLQQEESGLLELPSDDEQSMLYLMDVDHTSVTSEQDDTSHTTDDLSLTLKPGIKRKWPSDVGDRDEMMASFDAFSMDCPPSAGTPLLISGSQIPLLEGDPADWSLTTYLNSPEPDVQSTALTDLEYIATAQILGDQAVSGTIKVPGSICPGNDQQVDDFRTAATRTLVHSLDRATKTCLADMTNCTLRSFLDVQGIPVLNPGLRLPPRPNTNHKGAVVDPLRASNPFPIISPQLEVRRADSKLSVLPSAASFWENLSLSPSSGSKDVNAVCVYPNADGIAGNSAIFLDQMRSVYESSRLGGHERVACTDIPDGLVPFNVDPGHQVSNMHHLTALKEATARLGKALASLSVEEKNFVVYFVYPIDNPTLLVHICSAFQHLFDMYRKALLDRKINVANELVLQLVPLDFVASPTSLVVPAPTEYARLAMEVYDRCTSFASSQSTPGVLLEQPLPKNIDFKLNQNPSASLLQENSCLHIAYAQSIDDRWITAAWSDNRGTQQMTASYCLGRKNEPISTSFSDVAHEIWETTLEIISKKRIHWRVMIARVGVMDPSEVEFWAGLASTESNAQVNLTLITVQTDPSLRLLPAPSILPPVPNAVLSVATPVSTPQTSQAAVFSPEPIGTPSREPANASTPVEGNAELDSDARLVDYTDQSWGAVLAHRLNNSNSLLELNPALISGYLIKNGGTTNEDPPIVMEVNIVHCEVAGNPRTFHENLLREILGYYRNLGTLARVRGIVDPVKDVRPWHVAAAEKAVKALYMLM
jgi:mediator of RNA polymerase II transcription subunit 13